MELFGVKLVGLNAEVGQKVLFTVVLVLGLWAIGRGISAVLRAANRRDQPPKWVFWVRQVERLAIFAVATLGLVSIWLDEPKSLSTAFGLVTAGPGLRPSAGGDRLRRLLQHPLHEDLHGGRPHRDGRACGGDVMAIGFLQTTIMEMGQPPSAASSSPDVWVKSRQYTGRVVAVSNGKIFEEPIYNYSRDFEYIWESITLPIEYTADRRKAEQILLAAARDHTLDLAAVSEGSLQEMQETYFVTREDMEPRVYFRITDNWLELSLRFVVEEHGIRAVKDAMSRQIVDELDAAGIGIASATYDIVGMPKLEIAGLSDRAAPGKADREPAGGEA